MDLLHGIEGCITPCWEAIRRIAWLGPACTSCGSASCGEQKLQSTRREARSTPMHLNNGEGELYARIEAIPMLV